MHTHTSLNSLTCEFDTCQMVGRVSTKIYFNVITRFFLIKDVLRPNTYPVPHHLSLVSDEGVVRIETNTSPSPTFSQTVLVCFPTQYTNYTLL